MDSPLLASWGGGGEGGGGYIKWQVSLAESLLLLNNSLGSGEEKSKSVSVTCPIKNNQFGQEMSVCLEKEQRAVEVAATNGKLLRIGRVRNKDYQIIYSS